MLEVVEPGLGTTIQDRGRHGLAHLGVSPSGVVDPVLAGLVNRLVGNEVSAAVIETCGQLTVRAHAPVLIATSTELAPVSIAAGEQATIRAGSGRLWHYLAVRGGIDVEPVLGARATDTLSGLGPPIPVAGSRLTVGPEPASPVTADVAPIPPVPDVARLCEGPRASWFAPGALSTMAAGEWTVTTTSRVGVRLSGPLLERVVVAELPSEGLVRGAIQVPPDGIPVMMLADHPTTGGYPVIAVVHPDDVASVAQHSPGTRLGFRM